MNVIQKYSRGTKFCSYTLWCEFQNTGLIVAGYFHIFLAEKNWSQWGSWVKHCQRWQQTRLDDLPDHLPAVFLCSNKLAGSCPPVSWAWLSPVTYLFTRCPLFMWEQESQAGIFLSLFILTLLLALFSFYSLLLSFIYNLF